MIQAHHTDRDFVVLEPWVIALAIVAGVMLFASLFYPFGYDQAVFSTAGDMILHGAVPYRNFLDTKQPLIYYVYAAALGIFGRHEWSIHAFDILCQSGAAYYFFRILRRYSSVAHSLLSVSLMVILYAGSGFWMTAQAETFALLPSLLLLDATLRAHASGTPVSGTHASAGRVLLYGMLAGLAAVVLFALKFTLVFGAVASLIFVLFHRRAMGRMRIVFVAGFFAVAIALLALGAFLLWQAGAMERFVESLAWLSSYASLVPVEHSWPIEFLVIFPERIVYSLSVALAIFSVVELAQWIPRWVAKDTEFRAPTDSLFALLALTGALQLLGVLLERKIEFPYQYSRALWAIVPFAALAILCYKPRLIWTTYWRRALSAFVILLSILLSPLARIITQTIPWSAIAVTHRDAAIEVQHRIPNYFAKDQWDVARFLDQKMAVSDNLFFWGNDVAIYFFSNRLPQTLCLTATPLRTAFTPPEWKGSLLRELSAELPRYWVVEYGDAEPSITGSSLDSYHALRDWPELNALLVAHYSTDTTIGHFVVFRKIANVRASKVGTPFERISP